MKKEHMTLLASVGLTCLSQAAFAQEVPQGMTGAEEGAEANNANEIIVSARRREESVQDVPQTVNVVTAAQMEKLNLREFTDVQSVVPGLSLQTNSSFSSQASVRGVAFIPEASASPTIQFYLNDAPISSNFLFQSTYDFGQFELQRGPQGTLRGLSSPSGSIAVTVRRPNLDEAGVVMNGTINNLHGRKLDGAFNIPIIRDVLGIRLAGALDRSQGNRVRSIKELSDPTNNEGPYRRSESIRASVRFEPTNWAKFNFMYQNLHSEGHSFLQVTSDSLFSNAVATTQVISPFERLSNADQGTYERQDHEVFIGNADISFAGQKLSYVGSYSKQRYGSLGPQDDGDFFSPPRIAAAGRTLSDPAGFFPACQDEGGASGVTPTTGAYFQCTSGLGASTETHELRLSSEERIAGIFDYVVGALYAHNTAPTRLTQETPILLFPNSTSVLLNNLTSISRDGQNTEKSIFGNLTAHLGSLELSGGLRHIKYKDTGSLVVGGATVLNDSSDLSATIYSASAKYQINPDVMVYASTGSSWRYGPRVIGNFSVGPTGVEGPTARERSFMNLPAERSKSYEIGAKTAFADGRGRFNVSAYYQDFDNYIFRGPAVSFISYSRLANGTISPAVANFNFLAAVPVQVKGIEAEASFQVTDRWSIGGNVSYADGQIKNGTISCNDFNGDGAPDINAPAPTLAQLQAAVGPGQTVSQCSGINRPALNTPKFGLNIQTEYGFSLSSKVDGFVRGLATVFGNTRNDPNNTADDVGAYGLLNLYTGLRDPDGAWEIMLFGKNILQQREVLSVGASPLATSYRAAVGGAQTYTSQYRSASVTAPREFGVTARFALGSR